MLRTHNRTYTLLPICICTCTYLYPPNGTNRDTYIRMNTNKDDHGLRPDRPPAFSMARKLLRVRPIETYQPSHAPPRPWHMRDKCIHVRRLRCSQSQHVFSVPSASTFAGTSTRVLQFGQGNQNSGGHSRSVEMHAGPMSIVLTSSDFISQKKKNANACWHF